MAILSARRSACENVKDALNIRTSARAISATTDQVSCPRVVLRLDLRPGRVVSRSLGVVPALAIVLLHVREGLLTSQMNVEVTLNREMVGRPGDSRPPAISILVNLLATRRAKLHATALLLRTISRAPPSYQQAGRKTGLREHSSGLPLAVVCVLFDNTGEPSTSKKCMDV
eukprot:4236880-Pyramimonas_sp.AAC.1